jgi:hypothetical protein
MKTFYSDYDLLRLGPKGRALFEETYVEVCVVYKIRPGQITLVPGVQAPFAFEIIDAIHKRNTKRQNWAINKAVEWVMVYTGRATAAEMSPKNYGWCN